MYVLDTNTLIYFFKGIGEVSQRLFALPPQEIGVPTIVLYELEVGIAKSTSPRKRKAQLQDFVALVQILAFGHSEAKIAAQVRVNLEKQGESIGPYDVLIAAVALSNKGTLVTHNTREFGRIKGLRVADWFSS
jgi:tRNA(fMet)-specific endonuclease VapC